jgi:hypothetical protein
MDMTLLLLPWPFVIRDEFFISSLSPFTIAKSVCSPHFTNILPQKISPNQCLHYILLRQSGAIIMFRGRDFFRGARGRAASFGVKSVILLA